MRARVMRAVVIGVMLGGVCGGLRGQDKPVLVPVVDGEFWSISHAPDLGALSSPKEQPVDFAIWQAADGTWQLWSCIRNTLVPGKTRLFYRWQADKLTDVDWKPMGIAMMADPGFGETEGGLQAPYVFKEGTDYIMLYGEWDHIAMAKSKDGKTFARQLGPYGRSGMFGEGPGTNTRDPMVRKIGDMYYVYYSAYPDNKGYVFARTSKDMVHWSAAVKVAYGGSGGDGRFSAECPWVYFDKATEYYYLLRNQFYGAKSQFKVYRSKDPLDFGKADDKYLVETLTVGAAPEIVQDGEQLYLAVVKPGFDGIQLAKLKFAAQ